MTDQKITCKTCSKTWPGIDAFLADGGFIRLPSLFDKKPRGRVCPNCSNVDVFAASVVNLDNGENVMTETISIPSKLLEKMIDVAAERRSTPTAAPAPVTPETMALAAKRAGELLSRKIEKYAADHDITYTDAYEVMKTRPDLWKGL